MASRKPLESDDEESETPVTKTNGAGSQFRNNEPISGEIVDLPQNEDEDLPNHEEEDSHLRENHSSRVVGNDEMFDATSFGRSETGDILRFRKDEELDLSYGSRSALEQLDQEEQVHQLGVERTVSSCSREQLLRDSQEPQINQRSQSLCPRELFRDLRHFETRRNTNEPPGSSQRSETRDTLPPSRDKEESRDKEDSSNGSRNSLQQLNQEPRIQELEGEGTVSSRNRKQLFKGLPEPRIPLRPRPLRPTELFGGLRHERVAHAYNVDENDQVNIGENITVHVDTWETMIRKSDFKFVRELLEVIWGRETLKKKFLSEKRANKENVNDEGLRRTLTPRKVKLVEELLYEKITSNGAVGFARKLRMSKLSRYITLKIGDVRRSS